MTQDPTTIRQAVILAGGRGTRLGNLTDATPKPLLPAAGKPFIAYLIDWLVRHGIEDIVLSVGYLAEQFSTFLDDRSWHGPAGEPVRLRLVEEDKPAGTGGALRYVGELLDERFLLLNGDTWFDFELLALLRRGAILRAGEALMTLRQVADAERYGRVELNGHAVTSFAEKSGPGPGLINAGASIITRALCDMIETLPCSIENDIFPSLAKSGKLFGLAQTGYLIDIGLPETYDAAQSEFIEAVTRPAAFFDRDGVLNIDKGYVHRPEDFTWVDGAAAAIKKVRQMGYRTIVVTNQAGVARGFYDEDTVKHLHHWINDQLRPQDTQIDAFYYAPYHPEGKIARYAKVHPDRKPSPGMLQRAFNEQTLRRRGSFLIGDTASDLAAAKAAGVPGHLFQGGTLLGFVEELVNAGHIKPQQNLPETM